LYSSALFVYYNDADPSHYASYIKHNSTRPVSAAVEEMLAAAAYKRLYLRLEDLVLENKLAEAGYQLEILGRVALARGGDFTVRELAPDAAPFTIHLPPATGGVHPTMDLDGDWKALPRASTARKLLFSVTTAYPNFDLVDDRYRAYNFTVSKSHSIAHDSLVNKLESIGATKKTPLRMYFCVPKFAFDGGFKSAQAMKARGVNVSEPLRASAAQKLKQYALLVPAKLEP
jgi:hypothetical protein